MSESSTEKLRVPINEDDHSIGPNTASVTVVHYGDYQCPDCSKTHRQIERIFDELIHSVRFVYRHFPVVKVHPQALRAAEAAEAAAAQGKFWEMHRLLYTRSTKLDDAELRGHARRVGLDLERYDRDMATNAYADRVLKDYYNSIVNGITGTPTTFINGVLFPMGGLELLTQVKAMVEDQST
jgi:formate-nitrite transporter family protein